jgi:hypothetical protein
MIFILSGLTLLSLYIAAIAFTGWIAGKEYEAWQKKMLAINEGGTVRLEPVFLGQEVVGYTVVSTSPSRGL